MSKICARKFLELNWLDVHDTDIFKFYNNQCPVYFNEFFYPVDDKGVATRSSNKKFKLPIRKSELEMQSLSYVGPSTWNILPNNLKTVTSIN